MTAGLVLAIALFVLYRWSVGTSSKHTTGRITRR
jgi:hypothetical protein